MDQDSAVGSLFGPELRRRRNDRGKSLRQAASESGVGKSTWEAYEAGAISRQGVRLPVSMNPDTVARMARYLIWPQRDALTLAGFDPDQALGADDRLRENLLHRVLLLDEDQLPDLADALDVIDGSAPTAPETEGDGDVVSTGDFTHVPGPPTVREETAQERARPRSDRS